MKKFGKPASLMPRYASARLGVGVVGPDTTQPVRLREDGEGVDPGAPQLDRHAQAAEAGADDDDAGMGARARWHVFVFTWLVRRGARARQCRVLRTAALPSRGSSAPRASQPGRTPLPI